MKNTPTVIMWYREYMAASTYKMSEVMFKGLVYGSYGMCSICHKKYEEMLDVYVDIN